MERNLSFRFEYSALASKPLTGHFNDNDCPEAVHVTPNPNTVSDIELLLTASTCIQALATKHGLEQALTMVQNAVMGRLINGSRFDTVWTEED